MVLTHSFPTRRPSVLIVPMLADQAPRRLVTPDTAEMRRYAHRSADVGAKLARHHAARHSRRRAARRAAGRARMIVRIVGAAIRSEEHTSELQSLMRISYAVFCLKKKKITNITK